MPQRRHAPLRRQDAIPAGPGQMRRGGGLRRLPDVLTRVLHPAARRRGVAEARLLTEWPAIVGPELASRCQPIRLSKSTGWWDGGLLVLHAAGTAALELQHSEPQLLERINGFFGYRAVSRLRLIQAPLRASGRPGRPAPRALSEAEEAEVADAVRAVTDAGLRTALASLGRALKR